MYDLKEFSVFTLITENINYLEKHHSCKSILLFILYSVRQVL